MRFVSLVLGAATGRYAITLTSWTVAAEGFKVNQSVTT